MRMRLTLENKGGERHGRNAILAATVTHSTTHAQLPHQLHYNSLEHTIFSIISRLFIGLPSRYKDNTWRNNRLIC